MSFKRILLICNLCATKLIIIPCFVLLVRRVGMGVTRVQLRDHVDESHVHEDAGGPHEDPGGQVLKVAQQHSDHHSDECQNGTERN